MHTDQARTRRRRRWQWGVAGVLLLLGAALAYVFSPAVQRDFLLARATPWVDSLTVESVHLMPWSLRARGVEIVHRGGRYRIGKLDLGFNPLALLQDTVSITSLTVQHTDIDIRQRQASTPSSTPFAGLLPTLDHGYALALEDVDAAVSVMLAGEHALSVRLQGGGVRPHVAGELDVEVGYRAPGTDDRIDVQGTLALSQLARGRIREFIADVDVALALAALPAPERAHLRLRIAPPPGLLGSPYRKRFRDLPDGRRVALPNPESVTVELALPGDLPGMRAELTLDGLYRGEDGALLAGYRLRANETLLAPYVHGALPALADETRGALQLDTLRGSGLVTFETRLEISALDRLLGATHTLPTALTFTATANGTFTPARFDLAAFHAALADRAPVPRLEATLTDPVSLAFAAPLDILAQPRSLVDIRLGPVPLGWFDGFVSPHHFSGELSGGFALVVDEQARFKLDAVVPTRFEQVRVSRDDTLLVESLAIALKPTASWSEDFIRGALNDLAITVGDDSLAQLNVKIASRQQQPVPREWRYRLQGGLDFDTLRRVPVVAAQLERYTLPAALALQFKARIGHRADTLGIEKFDLAVGAPTQSRLLEVTGLQTFTLRAGADGVHFENPRGQLVSAAINNLNLDWLSPFLPALALEGRMSGGAFTLSTPSPSTLDVAATSPLRVDGLSVRSDGRPLMRDLTLETTPTFHYAKDGVRLALAETTVRAGARTLVSGSTSLTLKNLAAAAPAFEAGGKLVLDLGGLARQPVVAAALPSELPAVPLQGNVAFALAGTPAAFKIDQAHAVFKLDGRTTVTLEAEPGLTIRPHLAAGESLAQHVVGALALDIADLPSSTLAKFVPLGNLAFAEINSSLRLRSDGRLLRATSLAPLGIEDVRLTDGERPLLEPFSLRTTANLRIERQRVRGTFEETALTFAGRGARAALAGDIRAEVEPGRRVPLTLLDAELRADLPQLLAQPMVMPGHKLTTGSLTLKAKVDDTRHLTGTILLDQLAASTPLAIQTFELPITGEMEADGKGFDFTAPLLGRGKSGLTNATVVGHYAPQPDEPRVLRLDIASDVFYLNDILATAAAVSPQRATTATGKTGGARAALNETPDATAAWKVIPYAVVIALDIDKLYYSDYLAFTDVRGTLDLRRRKFALSGIEAHFHESAIAFDGVTRFTPGSANPYDLQITGKVTDFDLNQFFTALVPEEKSRVEGLFGVDFKAFGQFPNFSQLRNRALFDVRMRSRQGLFRPLPPDSGLLVGASDVLGLVGEGLSYMPTGGFGAGAVARLVNYIAEIDYDTIDIHLKRDASRNVQLEQFLMLSPTIALTASGGITHEAGEDILDSPLEINANLDMLGRGAAILYSMDLMQDGQDPFGYWRGPEFRIWGSVNAPQSNFEAIIKQAGDGTVKGAITRPISGLIGNLKYRWFNNDKKAKAAARAEQRALEEKARAEAAAEAARGTTPAEPAPAATPPP